MIKVTIYEDNTDLRESLTSLIVDAEGFDFCGAFENCDTVENDIQTFHPDVVLMDIDMPGTNGLEGLKRIKKKFPETNILMLTVFDDNEKVFDCICNGATGYLLKRTPPAKILDAIHDIHQGGAPMTASIARKVLLMFPQNATQQGAKDYHLSDREKETLHFLVKGFSYKMIASEMKISIDTVRAHIKKIYQKLQVHTMTEAVAKSISEKIVQ